MLQWLRKNWAVTAVMVLLMGAGFLLVSLKSPIKPSDAGHTVNRTIRYGFVVQNTTTQPLKDIRFWARAPVQQTATQQRRDIQASHPFEIQSDGTINQVLSFHFETLPPLSTKIITVSAALELADRPNRLSGGIGPEYLQPEPFIESNDRQIRTLVEELLKQPSDPSAQKLYQWVVGNVKTASYRKNMCGALHALRLRAGDCTDQALLFVAMCRAAKIPARAVGGYLCDNDTVLDPSGYHNWAEFYHDGRWRIADPFYRVFDPGKARYVAMRMIRPSPDHPLSEMARFRVSGEGVVARMGV